MRKTCKPESTFIYSELIVTIYLELTDMSRHVMFTHVQGLLHIREHI